MFNLENEKIILVARKHWFVLFADAFFLVFLLIIPAFIILAYQIFDFGRFIEISGEYRYLLSAITFSWLLFLWISFFIVWTNYFLDILILTDKKIIDIDQKTLFSRNISTLQLDRIQDVTTVVSGILPTFLDFGDVRIQTAGAEKEFILKSFSKPYKVKEAILREQARFLAKQ